ncbi:sporulation protein Cse60 [Cohnella terricola]|uniref:Sporulation protein Cse60 n=1 Tax=Cohnella terricola TaxID=1289167 RepID=A0A559JND5_9BACL|nr:sporulation protein Cse60 [Cohnella terricola]TVY01394.1 sporulation protein Cse60 [Cohnella terricola]
MIRVKEFLDTDSSLAEKRVNEFLAGLRDDQVVNICYSSISKTNLNNISEQRSAILVVYKIDPDK